MSKDAAADRGFFGHPRGLSTLFFTEMWERFSYYGMRAFLGIFMTTAVATGGLGFDVEKKGLVYGTYTAMVYLLALPGGWIADRFMGQRRAVFVGGVLIMCGHIALALPTLGSFYLGLALISVGTGLLKPNISAMVGQLYGPEDHRRDAGFSIFYMGINLGGFFAPLVCGYFAQSEGFRATLAGWGIDPNACWHIAFGMAAVGMGFGLFQYWRGGRHLGDAGLRPVPPKDAAEAAKNKKILGAVLGSIVGIPIVLVALHFAGVITLSAELVGESFGIVLIVLAVALFAGLFFLGVWSSDEKKRLLVILLLFLGAIGFFAGFEQAGGPMTDFATNHTESTFLGFEFPSSWFASLNSIFVLALAPIFAIVWVKLGDREPSSPTKFGIGMVFLGLGFVVMIPAGLMAASGKASPGWLALMYLLHTIGELCLSPVGLSSMTKLAPTRIGGMVMGIWFFGSAIGNYCAGRASSLQVRMSWSSFFLVFAVVAGVFALVFFVLSPRIRKMLAAAPAGSGSAGGH